MKIGDKLICHSENYGYTVGCIYLIVGIYQASDYGDCIQVASDDVVSYNFSVNVIKGLSYATWFKDIKEDRKNKLRKLNFIK